MPLDGIGAKSQCEACNRGEAVERLTRGVGRGRIVHPQLSQTGQVMRSETVRCLNWDSENRHIAESLGWYTFAWMPKRCRNGKLRWLCWVERHSDGTYTLGNRAH